jgi:membrane-bound metal-dependent hydrolase YbcI (DUF457 family)
MFIGHYGIAFALKRAYKELSIGWLFVAVQLVDIVWTVLILFGIEKVAIVPGITKANLLDFYHYPYTHSFVAFLFWSGLVFLICIFMKNKTGLSKLKFGLILAFAVFSHFLLDVIVHRPDIPLAGSDSFKIGMGLWNNVAFAYILEALIFIGGVLLYFKSGLLKTKKRKIGLIVFAVCLMIMNLINLLGPPPLNTNMVASSGLVVYIVIALIGFWIDKQKV